MSKQQEEETESVRKILRRTARTARQAGFLRDLVHAKWTGFPSLLPVLLREGTSIRTIHHVNANLHPERLAIVDEERRLTFREANDEINRLANAMRRRFDVGPGTPVAMAMQNRAEYLLIWMALTRLGASTVHASWRQTADELGYQIEHSRAPLLFAGQAVGDAVEELEQRGTLDEVQLVAVDEGICEFGYDELVAMGSTKFPRVDGETPASENIVYTSGTTGRPKGAVRDMAAYGIVEFFRILDRLPVRTTDRHLVVGPMYHSGAQIFSVLQTSLGATVYLLPKFDAEQTLQTLHEEAINSIFLVPTMLRRILDLPQEIHEKYSTPSLRGIFCGAAVFPHSLRQRAIERFGASVIHDFYGATEIGWITLIDGEEMLEKPGSVGRPIAGQQVRIVGEDGKELGADEPGVLYARNKHIMAGYLDDDRATDEIIDDGWMTVDDLAYRDEDGYLYIVGRGRDMVISGGVNIYPAQIEAVLDRHESVREVSVVGVPDAEFGEALVAVVVPEDETVDTKTLAEYAKQRLSSYKVPRQWHLVDELPRNPTGKVLKRVLEDRFGSQSEDDADQA